MMVRHVFALETSVWQDAPTVTETLADALGGACRWRLRTILQKDICFTSLSGLTGCTTPTVSDLPQRTLGQTPLDTVAAADPLTCTLAHPAILAAEARLSDDIRRQSQQIAEDDYSSQVQPMLERSGARIRQR
jgi:hypothetical protein